MEDVHRNKGQDQFIRWIDSAAQQESGRISSTALMNIISSGIISRAAFRETQYRSTRQAPEPEAEAGPVWPVRVVETRAEAEPPSHPIEWVDEPEGTHKAQLSLIWHGIRYTSSMEAIQTLKSYLGSLEVGPPITHENLSLFPVTDGQSQSLTYLLLEEAMATGKFQVTELGVGTVPELRLVNGTGQMVFLMDGEALVGAKQNRTLNTSILAAAKSSFDIPVSCVEQGRWAFARREMRGMKEMRGGSITYPDLRKMKHRSVHDSLHFGGSYRSDQGRIWQSVHAKLESMKVGSATANMEEVYSAHESPIKGFTDNLACPAEACGVIAAIDGAIVCADLFDSAATLEKLWTRLVSSYAMDALEATLRRRYARAGASAAPSASASSAPAGGLSGGPSGRPSATAKADTSAAVTEKEAAEFLQIPEDAETEVFDSPGLGENVRFRHSRCSGHALVYEGTPIHAAVFGPDQQPAAPDRPIRRPSQRRPV